MNSICIFMPTTINVDTISKLYLRNQLTPSELRYDQYYEGIKKIYELNKDKNIDIYLSDNSDFFDNDSVLKNYINNINNIKIIKGVPNNYGKINKGSGLIENWLHNKDLIQKYDWMIHFEPRQLLQSNQFIDNLLTNPRNLFTIGRDNNHFNTGLFCIKSNILFEFINTYSPENLIKNNLGIEYALYFYIIRNNIKFNTIDKMDLIWLDYSYSTIKIHNM